MKYSEIKFDLFKVDSLYYLVHCISADYELGKGIAVQFEKRFNLRLELFRIGSQTYPDCIQIDRVFNLVTKKKYSGKPTYKTLIASLQMLKEQVVEKNIDKLAMPKIGCGLDKLEWPAVSELIKYIFADVDVDILICDWQ